MASQLKVDTITGVTTAGSISVTGEGNSTTTNMQQGLAKAWNNMNGTGTIATRDSFNIASISDEGTGNYKHNFTNSMGSTEDFVASGFVRVSGNMGFLAGWVNSPFTSSSFEHASAPGSFSASDAIFVTISIHGDLA